MITDLLFAEVVDFHGNQKSYVKLSHIAMFQPESDRAEVITVDGRRWFIEGTQEVERVSEWFRELKEM